MEAGRDSRTRSDATLPGGAAFAVAAPSISLPKSGGAIRGIGEKFAANPSVGTGSMSVPVFASPGRCGLTPELSLSYDSGNGNGPFGVGWRLSLTSIARKTDKGLPTYRDAQESDTFIIAGAEDLVPALRADGSLQEKERDGFRIRRYRPRVESGFARIERWTNLASGDTHWRSITRDSITTLYGTDNNSRLCDPSHPSHVFSWLICQRHDDKGNAIVYEYAPENSDNVNTSSVHEMNRTDAGRTANRYIKRIKYGNRTSRLITPDLTSASWLFEIVFDYGEAHYQHLPAEPGLTDAEQHARVRASTQAGSRWALRPDPFSTYRAGYETRSYRRCHRILMFHRFDELGEEPYLVRSTELGYADLDIQPDTAVEVEQAHPGSTRFASFLREVIQSGFVRTDDSVEVDGDVSYLTYIKKSLPPVEFDYSKALIDDEVREIDRSSLENLPVGLDGSRYRWVDLDGEGLSGVLTEQGGTWLYKPNLSALAAPGHGDVQPRFGPQERVRLMPAPADLAGAQQLLDLAGDGQLDVVAFDSTTPGYFERTADGSWAQYVAFESVPKIAWRDPNVKFVDLTGDGHADIFITEDEAFTWYPSQAEAGFGPAERVRLLLDEEQGPRLVFNDGAQSIYLADMSGDGLIDLVRVRNGEVCYWPNLGYGRFGAKVSLENAPWFDSPDQFDQRRIRLADIDGSGTTDIFYLARDGVRIYFNQSGNRLAEARRLPRFPALDDFASITPIDLFGNGTSCLVWSSPLSGNAPRVLRYVDLMGGGKPHLLIKTVNNLGADTHVSYAPSTRFYLADKIKGTPWVTRLPFPVHLVERVETTDHIGRDRFVTRYAYHHGYFDGVEREFRGFGMVEQWDTEEYAALTDEGAEPAANLEASSHIPPVLTRTWFHTGAYLGRERISKLFAGLIDDNDVGEYYREPGLSDMEARQMLLEDTLLPASLSVEEEREACRALKGMMLRQEMYALDGTDKAAHPYKVTEQNFSLRLLQPKKGNRHAVFLAQANETINYHYEREPSDPRTTHELTLEADEFGNVRKSVTVSYGRRHADTNLAAEDQKQQTQSRIVYSENEFTNPIEEEDAYRTPLPSESRTYELTGYASAGRFQSADFIKPDLTDPQGIRQNLVFDGEIDYEQDPGAGKQRRLIEHVRTLYRRNDLTGALEQGVVESLALPFERYKLAFTPGLLADIYGGRVTDAMLQGEGRYAHSDGDALWWIPSGRVFYSPDPAATATQELAFAREHFFLPHRFRDPFHTAAISTESFVRYDAYDLLTTENRDALGNRTTVGERNIDPSLPLVRAGHDYRVLQTALLMDPNRNRTAVAFDALGRVVGTALLGKPEDAPRRGDLLDGFEAELTEAVILDHLADPLADPHAVLQRATMRLIVDSFAYYRTRDSGDPQPAVVYSLVREIHDADLTPPAKAPVQHSFTYSDGFGREIQKKIQAEAGPAPRRDPVTGKIVLVDGRPEMTPDDIAPRWVGSGWTVFNNKGKAVRQYEPFFTDAHGFEFDLRIGVSSIIFYDPIGRVVATLHPNHTWQKAVLGSWRRETWDANDTVLMDPRTDPSIQGAVANYFAAFPDWRTWHELRAGGAMGMQEQSAANKAADHASTPTRVYFDPLGRPFLTVADNGAAGQYSTRVYLDIEGNQRRIVDARDRLAFRYDCDMLGNRIRQASAEAGTRWILGDVAGKPIRSWDSLGHEFRTEYDVLRRPLRRFARGTTADSDARILGVEVLFSRTEYGEGQTDDVQKNLRTQVFRQYDSAGIVTNEQYDFKGNLLHGTRQLAQDHENVADWSVAVSMAQTYTNRTAYDARNRPLQAIAPHSAAEVDVVQMHYNAGNLLETLDVWFKQAGEPADLLPAASADQHFVTDIDYDARGQRRFIAYGNGVRTDYRYDPDTFRLTHLYTARPSADFAEDDPTPPDPPRGVQNLHYVYDAVGNVVHIHDDAQQAVYFRNQLVEASNDFVYDAMYRLLSATGREHLGQAGAAPAPSSYNDASQSGVLHPGDGNAMGAYQEGFTYDEVGNVSQISHRGTDPLNPGWTRGYVYDENSPIDPGKKNNRLTRTVVGGQDENYSYDPHGNFTNMPQLQSMGWDFQGRLRITQRQAVNPQDQPGVQRQGERTFYVYDINGERVRKVTQRQNGTRRTERIYLSGFEIYREFGGDGTSVDLERETLHIRDDKHRIALAETQTVGSGELLRLIRYQFSNHLGSASLELDDAAQIISYEEYTPYGCTSYQAVRSQTEVAKRYRYTGKERDEESGLHYHGARYYAVWLGRWTSCDSAGPVDGTNLYKYASDNPLRLHDPSGHDPDDPPLQFQLPRPSLLDPPQTPEEHLLNTLSGTLLPPLSLTPPVDLRLPGVPSLPPWHPAPESGGDSRTTTPSPDTPAPDGGSSGGPEVTGSVIPPRFQLDWGIFRFSADTSSTSVRFNLGEGSLTTSYHYGGDISLTSRGPSGAGTVAVDPSSGLTTFSVEGTHPDLTSRFSFNTEGRFGLGVTAHGFRADTGFNPLQQSVSLSLGFGGEPAPIFAPGYSGTLLPELGGAVRGGVQGATDLLLAAPGMTTAILDDPTAAPDVVSAHQSDIDAVSGAVKAGSAIADAPRAPAAPDIRFRLDLSYSPPSTGAAGAPAGGFTFTTRLQVIY